VCPAFSLTHVGPDTWLTLSYRVFDADGDEVEDATPDAPLEVVFGHAQLLPAIEQAIEGLGPGQKRSLTLPPAQAFGERNPRALIEVDRGEFPPDVAPGDHFEVENEEGELLVLKVLDVGDEHVVLDTNHPLAGQRVRIDLTVHEVRPATEEELEEARTRLTEPAPVPEAPLIGVERLLRGGTQH
jgi:FKBP-type peptidyl-prolyl cis-trans isomerase SlyD